MSRINEQLEISILGCLINNGELLYKVTDILDRDCFTTCLHQALFECIKSAQLEHGGVSKVQLYHKFEDAYDGDGVKLKQNFLDIASAESGVVILNFRSHVLTLVDLKRARQIDALLSQKKIQLDVDDSLTVATSLLSQVTGIITQTPQESSVTIKQSFEEIYNDISSDEESYRASTGLKILDMAMAGGMQKGRVYAFLAPAKCGKTMLATTVSNALCESGNKHLFVCAEMGSREIAERMLGQRLNQPTANFHRRKDEKLREEIAHQIIQIKDNVIFENEPAIDFDKLKTVIEKHVYKSKIEGFILDYYQLVTGQQRHETHAQHLENVANWIHQVCKKHNIWCLLLVQANDEGKVLGSRGLDRACDQKYMIHRPLDEQGDPRGSNMWLKMKLSRYTKLVNLGGENNPTLQISVNGTHLIELG